MTEEGYKVLGKKGPSIIIYKCVLVSLCRLGKVSSKFLSLFFLSYVMVYACIFLVFSLTMSSNYSNNGNGRLHRISCWKRSRKWRVT